MMALAINLQFLNTVLLVRMATVIESLNESAPVQLLSAPTSRSAAGQGVTSLRDSRGYRAHLCSRNAPAISGDASGKLSGPAGGFGGRSFHMPSFNQKLQRTTLPVHLNELAGRSRALHFKVITDQFGGIVRVGL